MSNNTINEKNAALSLLSAMRQLGRFSLPMIANQLLGIVPTLASMWILSRLGKDYIAAAGFAAPSFYTIITFFATGFYALGIKIGHCYGENKNNPQIKALFHNGILLALCLVFPAMLLMLLLPSLLQVFGQDPHLVELAKPFFYFGALSMIPIMINSAINQYFTAIGHPKIAFYLSIITFPLIICLSYGLVLGQWGLPKLAMGGITGASFIVDIFITVIAIMIACQAKWSKVYGVFSRPYGLNYHMVYQIVSLGWPIALQVSGELAAMTVAAYLMGLFGSSALAAQQIVGQFTILFVMISIGLSSAVSILVSHGYGERNLNAIIQTCKAGCVFGLMVSGLFALGFLVFPKTLVDLYLNIDHAAHSQLVDYAVYFMMVAVIYTSFDGIRAIFSNTLRGMQDAKTPMKISIFCLWAIGLPCAYIGGFVFSGGPVGLRIGFTICVLIAAPVMVQRCFKKWRMVAMEFQNGSN